MSKPACVVVRGPRVLDAAGAAPPRDILIRDGRIETLGPPGMQAPDDAQVVDATDRLVIPGLVNAHTHGHGSLGRGTGDRWTLELLLNAGRRITGHQTARHKYLAALLGALEMVQKGATAAYDLFVEFPLPTRDGLEAVGQAYADAGMRAVVAPMMADRTFYEAIPGLMDALPAAHRADVERARMRPAEAHLEVCREMLERWPFDRARVRPALAPTIPLHCTDAFITGCRDLAADYDVGLQMHLAESKVQAVVGMQVYGHTLAHHLDELGFLGPRFTGAHGVWLDPDDMRRLADHGAAIAHNPGSNLRLGSGLAAAREMLDAGVVVGIGTDGAACSDHQNMFEAMRTAAYVSRVRSHDPGEWLGAADVLRMATAGSARALGFGDDIGAIEPGRRADLVFLDLGHVHWIPMNDPVNQVVNTEDGSGVDGVMVDGEVIYWGRRHLTVDVARVRAEVEAAVEEMRPGLESNAALSLALEAHVGSFCTGLARSPYHVHALAGHDW